ncbi:MAG: hypothetical protein K9M13_03155, partial [Simkaniaceae bacterium]|nr:hypothetical protein [Simkaniaceae bacterium]
MPLDKSIILSNPLFRSGSTIKGLIFVCFFSLFFSGCGYQFVKSQDITSITVPFIRGDVKGILTEALIHEVNQSPLLTFQNRDARALLAVQILDQDHREIGYQYQTNDQTDALTNHLSPTESRQMIRVRVTLIDQSSGKKLIDPFEVEESIHYNYVDSLSYHDLAYSDAMGRQQTVLNTSLGQLDAEQDAQSISKMPLYQKLASKIITSINVAL